MKIKMTAAIIVLGEIFFSCAGVPRESSLPGGSKEKSTGLIVPYQVETEIPLFDSSMTGYAYFSEDLKAIKMRISLNLPDGREDNAKALLRKLLYAGKSPEEYAAGLVAATTEQYRRAGAVLLEEPEEFSGAMFNWYYTESFAIGFEDEAILVFCRDTDYFIGGAHGMRNARWFVIDREHAAQIRLEDILLDAAGLNRAALKVLGAEDLPQEGFSVPRQNLIPGADSGGVLTENFFLAPEGLGFHYDPYEIAPYVRGPVEIMLPFADIEGFLNPRGRVLGARLSGL